ncbi:thyroid transcription factor 1-associated protein 26 homolog [Nasonia vitripennis]|uniref:Thyroid transcription factor 1-associated protein 26 n=1 Tax=Nasonia vitripennis TaxID=7425 RepID=A0A7M7LMS9_NASVI|nr:thyroid transcription factor 1-associated protein 26 homolog [Nasonia vitripennis]XP_032454066.1 thyroid transcription factor 1-associated protein 26 homolog [Nasonia vitripennis]
MANRNRSETERSVKQSERNNAEGSKKPFNKKKYREQKYSNKFKVNQWEEKRKKAILKGFYKDLKKEEKAANFKFSRKSNSENPEDDNSESSSKKAKIPFFSAKQEYLKKKQEKDRKKEELLKAQEERKKALEKYKEKKMQTYKQLSKKTKKGQPVMKGRMELLLEKIQQST